MYSFYYDNTSQNDLSFYRNYNFARLLDKPCLDHEESCHHTTNMEIDEIKNIWYSLGLRGGNSENDWAIRIKFAKAIEEYLKGKK